MSTSVCRDYARVADFSRRVQDGFSGRRTRWAWGTALWHEEYPRIWDLNFLRLEQCEGASMDSLAREAEAVQGAAGLRHRKISVLDEECGRVLARPFERAGWRVQRLQVMVHDGRRRPAVRDGVEETPIPLLRPTLESYFRTAPFIDDEETFTQIVDQYRLRPVGVEERCLAVRAGDLLPAFCLLFSDGATAQVEDVTTLEEHRNKGLASAVVLHAVELALDEGHDLVFLVADAEDWPRSWYRKLGFADCGLFYEFVRDA